MKLNEKIITAINTINKAECLALKYRDYGFYLAFSGGKDSIVIYELCKMAGVKFKAVMMVTTIDPPELMKYVRKNYPDVILERPSINFYKLIEKKKMLPTRIARYCCQVLKEGAGSESVVITGIRKAESSKRAKRNELEISGHKYSNTLDQFNIDNETQIMCVSGKDKIILNPIINWTDRDVWDFIKLRKLPYCKLYDEGYKRIGCIFCPMASKRIKAKDRIRYPRIEQTIKKSITRLVESNNYGSILNNNVDDIFNWWVSNDTVKNYKGKQLQYTINFNGLDKP